MEAAPSAPFEVPKPDLLLGVHGLGHGEAFARSRVSRVRERALQITPDPMRHLITAVLPKGMVDKIIARRLGLVPAASGGQAPTT
jgi:hypothetical protein